MTFVKTIDRHVIICWSWKISECIIFKVVEYRLGWIHNMRNRSFKAELKFGYWSRMFIFRIEAFHNYHAEVIICNMVYLFPPDHWNTKSQVLIFSMGPWSESFHTACTDFMWKPCFILISKLDFKISKIGSLHKVVDRLSLCCWRKTSTNVAKCIKIDGVFFSLKTFNLKSKWRNRLCQC